MSRRETWVPGTPESYFARETELFRSTRLSAGLLTLPEPREASAREHIYGRPTPVDAARNAHG